MALDRKGIPAKVLKGEVPKYKSVHNAYKALFVQEVMKRLNASFWARAKRGSDSLGNTWKPLSPKTHAYKPLSPMERKTYRINNNLNRGLLTPKQDKIWSGIFASTYNRLVKQGMGEKEAKKKAGERAWAVLKRKGARTKIGLDRITDTNIRTGRLVAATRPGSVANNRYYPVKDQKVQYRPRLGVKIDFNIPYVKEVNRVRPIVPDNIQPWIEEAHDVAIEEAKRIYERIQSITPDRKKPTRRKSSNRYKRK